MLKLRVITAAIGLPLVILSIVLGEYTFALFLAVVSGLCALELIRLEPQCSRNVALTFIALILAVTLSTGRLLLPGPRAVELIVTACVLASLMTLLRRGDTRGSFQQWSWSMAVALYVGLLLGQWGQVYSLASGMALVCFGIFTTFFYDTFAFFTGRALGKHKMVPRLSAGKTWEGAAGGVVMAMVGGLLVRMVLQTRSVPFPFGVALTVVVALCLAIAAQMGDLVGSAVKRSAGVKDAGRILPGHGGMLDRFDSLLFTGPVLYYIALWVNA